jgi:ABC-type multidrug transport system ATPase subunit
VQQAINKNYKGHTVVVVAHRLSTIESADKIIVLNNGQIVEQGTHKELLRKQGLYAYLVNKQTHSSQDDSISQSGASTPVIPSIQPLSYLHDDKTSRRSDIEF